MNAPRILASSKYQSAIVVTVLGAIPVFYQLADHDIPRPDKTQILKVYIGGAIAAWLGAIVGTSAEDYAKNRDTPAAKPGPSVQVNTAGGNVQQATPAPAPPEAEVSNAKLVAALQQVNARLRMVENQLRPAEKTDEG